MQSFLDIQCLPGYIPIAKNLVLGSMVDRRQMLMRVFYNRLVI